MADYGVNGYISDIIGDEAGFLIHDDANKSSCTLALKLPYVVQTTIPGITIKWSLLYNEWPKSFSLELWRENNFVGYTELLSADSPETFVAWKISDYDEIKIKIFQWCKPYHRARVESVFLGVKKKFDKSDIISYAATMFVDPLSAALPKSEITFSVKQLHGEYNPDNPYNTQKYLAERQQLTVRYGYKINGGIEWINGGTYYLSEWTTPQNGITATFTARDCLEFMSETYTGPSTGTLYDIATAALNQANLPYMADNTDRWLLSETLKDISLTEEMGVDISRYSIAETLQCCANAACCVFYQDRDGRVHIEKFDISEKNISDIVIDRSNSYENAELKLSKQLKAVNVNEGQYIYISGTQGEVQPINNAFIADSQAEAVAEWASDYLQNRRSFSGSFRADPRIDPLDIARIRGLYSSTLSVINTFRLSYNGAFRGTYEAGGLDYTLSEAIYSDEIYSGEDGEFDPYG